jgi:uncharacterized protein YciI
MNGPHVLAMPLFLFIGHDHPPHSMALRDAVRAAHRTYVRDNDKAIRSAGAMLDHQGNQCGTVIAFEASDAAQVWHWVEREPFYRNGVYARTEVVEWHLAINRFDRSEWAVSGLTHGG